MKRLIEKLFKVRIVPEDKYMEMDWKSDFYNISSTFMSHQMKKLDRRRAYIWFVDDDLITSKAFQDIMDTMNSCKFPDMVVVPESLGSDKFRKMSRKDFNKLYKILERANAKHNNSKKP